MVADYIALAVFLAGQCLGGVIWLTHLGSRTSELERDVQRLTGQINAIDKEGTRALAVVEDRQKTVIERVERIEERRDHRVDRPNA